MIQHAIVKIKLKNPLVSRFIEMEKLWIKSVLVVSCDRGRVTIGIVHTRGGEYNPPWFKADQDTPDWFRDIKDLADDPVLFRTHFRL